MGLGECLSGLLGLILLAFIGIVLYHAGGEGVGSIFTLVGGVILFFVGTTQLANGECLSTADRLGWDDPIYDDMRAENAKTRIWIPISILLILLGVMY